MDVPRVRTVVETYSVTVFALQPNEIQNHFLGLVDGAISTSERALDEYVHAYVHGQLAAARARIQEYSER